MENLLLTKVEEFYMDGAPINALSDLKTINLFIGANNSRKSRLLRNIISIEKKMMVSTTLSLNQLYLEGSALTDSLFDHEKLPMNTQFIQYTGNSNLQPAPGRFSAFRNFFKTQPEQLVTIGTLKKILDAILWAMMKDGRLSESEKFNDYIKRYYDILDVLVYILEENDKGVNVAHAASTCTWTEHNLNLVSFYIQDLDDTGKIIGTKEKLELCLALRQYIAKLDNITHYWPTPKQIYIPTLRSSRNLLDHDHNLAGTETFKYTINFQYFGQRDAPNETVVHTGQEHYDLFDKAKRGIKAERNNFKEFEQFIGKSFYQGEDIEIVAHLGGRNPTIIISLPDEMEDVQIHNLGDGVQAIINLFFPIFTAEEGSWIFIEEPEINLHPGFQNLFIRTLVGNDFLKTKKLRYFINTHSNHILSEVLLNGSELSEVFVLRKRDALTSEIRRFNGFEHATLDLLGVLTTSTLISNCSIWVEGVTDRLYIRAFLAAYLKTRDDFLPIEGLNYSFIEYGGNNLVHYLFNNDDTHRDNEGISAFFVSSRIFLVADTDSGKEEKHQSYEKIRSDRFHYEQTDYPEIENILPEKLLRGFLKDRLKITEEKHDAVFSSSYQCTKLGKFFRDKFKKIGVNTVISAKTGGTLSSPYKSKLAEYTYQQVLSGGIRWETLSSSAPIKRITEALYNFIHASNR